MFTINLLKEVIMPKIKKAKAKPKDKVSITSKDTTKKSVQETINEINNSFQELFITLKLQEQSLVISSNLTHSMHLINQIPFKQKPSMLRYIEKCLNAMSEGVDSL